MTGLNDQLREAMDGGDLERVDKILRGWIIDSNTVDFDIDPDLKDMVDESIKRILDGSGDDFDLLRGLFDKIDGPPT